jgi:hypothetical protein
MMAALLLSGLDPAVPEAQPKLYLIYFQELILTSVDHAAPAEPCQGRQAGWITQVLNPLGVVTKSIAIRVTL